MKNILPIIFTFSLLAGQLIKFPQNTQGGATLLDLVIIFMVAFGFWKIKSKIVSPPKFIKAAFVFLAVAVISLILTPLNLSMEQYLISIAYPLRFLLYILFGWLTLTKVLEIPQKVLIYSGVSLAALGLLQLIFIPNLGFLAPSGWDPHYLRTASTLLDPNFLGAYLVLTLLLLTSKKNIPIFLITYLALVTTFSRSAAIMFVVSFVTLTILKKSPKLFILTIILSLGFGLGFLGYRQLIAQPRNIDRGQSAAYRLSSWEQGWTLFRSSPILGVGFNTYRFALGQYNLASDDFTESRGSSGSDSSLLFIAATTGIIGLVTYIYFIFILAQQNKLLMAGLAGLLIHSVFVNSLFYPWILIWIILMTDTKS